MNDNSIYKTKSDAQGNYTLSGLSDGEYQIIAQNDKYAKSSVQRVTLGKQSRVVVDFKLTATGSVSGKIAGANVVYIPGTDHISIAKEDGTFSLTGIPVGTYNLVYEDDYNGQKKSIEVTIKAGEVAAVDMESGFDTSSGYSRGDDFGYFPASLDLGVLELYYEGISFSLYHFPTYYIEDEETLNRILSKYVTLKNSAGEEIPFYFDMDYDGSRRYKLKTKEIVPAGDYTVTFSKALNEVLSANKYDSYEMMEDHSYTFHVDKLSAASAEVKEGVRILSLYFPQELSDTQKSALNDLKLVEAGTTDAIALKPVWSSDHELNLFGSFKTGVEYAFDLTDAQKEITGEIRDVDGKLMFGKAEVIGIYPVNGGEGVRLDQKLYVDMNFANELDPSTVKFVLDGKEYSGKAILFDGRSDYYEDNGYSSSSKMAISFDHEPLAYGKTYTLTFSAKDMSGNEMSATTSFKTMTPSIVELEPNGMDELFDDHMRVEFNVPVDSKSGTISIETISGDKEARIERGEDEYRYDTYSMYYSIEGLAPNQRYKVTVSGVKDLNGNVLPSKSVEFSTPPKMLVVPHEYGQKVNVSGEYANHQVKLYFFGGLTDAQKEALENNLIVQSYGQPVTVDDTHPVRKLFFFDEDGGTEVTVAFTIDPDTNYELVLSDKSAFDDIVIPDNTKLLSFATVRSGSMQTSDPTAFSMINYLNVSEPYLEIITGDNDEEKEESPMMISRIDADLEIPYATLENDNDGRNESCWNIAENEDIRTKANEMVEKALTVTDGENKVDIKLNRIDWYVTERWNSNARICYIGYHSPSYDGQSLAYFAADYNKTYDITLALENTLAHDVSVRNTQMSTTLTTAPVGMMEYGLFNRGSSDTKEASAPIYFNMHFNAPLKLDNLDNLFSVKVNGETYQPHFEYETIDGENLATEIRFAIPRTLYSVVQIEIAKNDGQDLTFINPLSGEEVVNNSAFVKPISIMEDVAPDLVPVKVEEVKTTSIANDSVVVRFNRAVLPTDVATIADDGSVSDVKLEVKANDGSTVAIRGVEGGSNELYLLLSEELNASKTYTISLKEGESIQAAFGAQKLKEFSQDIALTYADVGEVTYLTQSHQIEQDEPYMLGSTNYVYTNWNDNSGVMVSFQLKEGVFLDMNNTKLKVTYAYAENDIINKDILEVDAENDKLVQKLATSPYSIDVYLTMGYKVGENAYTIDRTYKNLYKKELPYVYSYYGDGANAVTFEFSNMAQEYQITADNFVVVDQEGNEVNATVNVQFNDEYNTAKPTVTLDNLEADTVYGIMIKGIPSYEYIPNIEDMVIDTLLVQTPLN